jgi:hypothetical protein
MPVCSKTNIKDMYVCINATDTINDHRLKIFFRNPTALFLVLNLYIEGRIHETYIGHIDSSHTKEAIYKKKNCQPTYPLRQVMDGVSAD